MKKEKEVDSKKDETMSEFLETTKELDTKKEVDTTLNIEKVTEIVEQAQEEKPKRRRRSAGRKSKAQAEEEKKKEEIRDILKLSFSYALIGVTSAISQIIKADKWTITDEREADYLAGATIQYLDERFPEWEKASPELNLIMAWSSYFAKRLFQEESKAE